MLAIMTKIQFISLLAAPALIFSASADDNTDASKSSEVKPLKALLITGGGYHDYAKQQTILTEGVAARANVEWVIDIKDDQKDKLPLQYAKDDWAKGYDIIVHNECYAAFKDKEAVEKIVA